MGRQLLFHNKEKFTVIKRFTNWTMAAG